MTEMEFQAVMNRNKCPAEYARELGHQVAVDCEKSGYDCRVCVAEVLERDKYRQ